MASALLVADLHLTNNDRDKHRWQIFNFIAKTARENSVTDVFYLGDITDAKDYHSSRVVNSICDAFVHVRDLGRVEHQHILRGNHDGTDASHPYFWFLCHIPRLFFYKDPVGIRLFDRKVLMLPHSRNEIEDWGDLVFSQYEMVFAHVTVNEAKGENDRALDGIGADIFEGVPVWSGDVHVPQTIGSVSYVGSPYHVHYGDSFNPRLVLLNERLDDKDINPENLERRMIDITTPDALKRQIVRKGDQVKVRVTLARAEYGKWHDYKKAVEAWAKERGLDLAGVELVKEKEEARPRIGRPKVSEVQGTPKDVLFKRYCARANVDEDLQQVGEELLK